MSCCCFLAANGNMIREVTAGPSVHHHQLAELSNLSNFWWPPQFSFFFVHLHKAGAYNEFVFSTSRLGDTLYVENVLSRRCLLFSVSRASEKKKQSAVPPTAFLEKS
jgi:hypothetical protein